MLGRLVSSRFKNNRSEEEISSIRLGLSIGVYHKRVTRKRSRVTKDDFRSEVLSSVESLRETPLFDRPAILRCVRVAFR